MPLQKRYIAHLDLDCFFVSVERTKDKSLIGKPVVVGGTPIGRGVVVSASYEARKFGVRSAMPAWQALRLCPHLTLVRGHYSDYSRISSSLYHRMLELAPIVERASIDEMYLDFTGCESLYNNDLPAFMRTLQHLVWDEFSLPCTIALASNKLVAKIATGTVKPEGVCHVPHGHERKFLAPLPVDDIPGVGPKSSRLLRSHGFDRIRDVQNAPREQLEAIFGEHGNWIFDAANGKGSDIVSTEHDRKSVGNEETFGEDIGDIHELEGNLFSLVEETCRTLRSHGSKGRTVTLKIRYDDFTTITRARSLEPTNDDAEVFSVARELLMAAMKRKKPVRLLGVRISNLTERGETLSLFPSVEKREKMFKALDAIRKKFGHEVIHSGKV